MHGESDERTTGLLQQALLSGAVIGVILLTLIGAILLTYTADGVTPDLFTTGEVKLAALDITPTTVSVTDIPTHAVQAATSAPTATRTPTGTPTPMSTRTATKTRTPSPTDTLTPERTASLTRTSTATAGSTASPSPTATCKVPPQWEPYTVQAGDELADLAVQRHVAEARIVEGNCLSEPELTPGQVIYLPVPTATVRATPTATPCGPPPLDWVSYVVRPGDTLGSLATRCSTTVYAIMRANCLNTTTLYAGQRLYLPCVPYIPPTATPVPIYTPALPTLPPTALPTSTPPLPATSTPTLAPPTATLPPPPTSTPTQTA